MITAIDIETIPNADAVQYMPEPDVKTGNLKDPVKIAEKVAEAKRQQVADMALDPLTGRVACVCFVGVKGHETFIEARILDAIDDAHEQTMLEGVFEIMGCDEARIVTWNGNGFDLPFLYKRALILGVHPAQFGAPPLNAWTKRYGADRHYDLMQIWTGWQGYAKLDTVARLVLHEGKKEMDPQAIPGLMQTPEGRAKVLDYCGQDTALTWRMFEAMQGFLFG